MPDLYKNIRERRIELGISQQELAEKLGYKDRSTIAKIESGVTDLPQSKIERFAAALHTTPSDLMGWEDPVPVSEVNAIRAEAQADARHMAGYKSLSEEDRKTIDDMISFLLSKK